MYKFKNLVFLILAIYINKDYISSIFTEEISFNKVNKLSNVSKIEVTNNHAMIYNNNKNEVKKYKLIIGKKKMIKDFIKKKLYNLEVLYIKPNLITFIINRILAIIFINYILKFILNISENKSNFKIVKSDVKLDNVIGLKEVKEEVYEFIDILKNNYKYQKMNCRIPKGMLFYGKPGIGKTLLAKAIANESKLSFLYANGSSFNEIYVGIGQLRVKQLFESARNNVPCIIFIDELDTLGKKRSNNSGYSESENTLNCLLAEMDGINNNENVLVIGSTNRPEVLDEALLRSGRFDRKIEFNLPNLVERKEIFRYYLSKYKINDLKLDFLSEKLAKKTFSMSSSDISNICNEAAIKAVVKNRQEIDDELLDNAFEYVLVGSKRSSNKLNENDKKIVSYHEIGHAFMSYILKCVESPIKISIIPTSKGALGFSMTPNEEKKLVSKNEMLDQMAVLIGGRCSESYFLDNITTGASNDLQKLKKLQLSYIKIYGFSDKYQNINLDFEISNNTKSLIDEDILILNKKIISFVNKCFEKNINKIKKCCEYIILNEEMSGDELRQIIGEDLESTVSFNLQY